MYLYTSRKLCCQTLQHLAHPSTFSFIYAPLFLDSHIPLFPCSHVLMFSMFSIFLNFHVPLFPCFIFSCSHFSTFLCSLDLMFTWSHVYMIPCFLVSMFFCFHILHIPWVHFFAVNQKISLSVVCYTQVVLYNNRCTNNFLYLVLRI